MWQHDLVLLLVPIFAIAHRARIALALALLVLVNVVALVMMLNRASSEWYVWVTPCVLLGCAVAASPRSAAAGIMSRSLP